MMLIAIWDFFFTRKQWKIIKETNLTITDHGKVIGKGMRYILQDQFGNIKYKDVE